MFLQVLVEYAHRDNGDGNLASQPRLYAEAPIRYIAELDSNGKFLGLVDTADPKNRATKNGVRRWVPNLVRGTNMPPLLFADSIANSFGITEGARLPDRVTQCHQDYLELLTRCAEITKLPEVQAAEAFMYGPLPAELADFDATARITFRVNGVFPHELPAVQKFWAAEHTPEDGQLMDCLVCGGHGPVVIHHSAKVKGIPGGMISGLTLTAAKGSAFASYGLEDGTVAPTCSGCAEQFTRSLNQLLRDPSTHITINETAYVFWTCEQVTFSIRDFLDKPAPEAVRELMKSAITGKRSADLDSPKFYCAALSAHGGRAVVRDWIDTTLSAAQRNLALWFKAQEVCGPWGEESRPFGVFALAVSTVRAAKDLPPGTTDSLISAALNGQSLPSNLLAAALNRIQAEQEVTHARAALITLALKGVDMENKDTDPAYQCGRLLAVLERAQAIAVPGIGAGLINRSMAAAMRAPAMVIPRLIIQSKAHMKKLQRERTGAYYALEAKIQEVITAIPAFPNRLTVNEQGAFVLGYYHQCASDRREAKARREAANDDSLVIEAEG
jgi:CRISPR-associated protein Csd1